MKADFAGVAQSVEQWYYKYVSSLEYHRAYNLRRYHRRRVEALELLGGRCARCGSPEGLEFDHKDRKKKSFDSRRWMNVALARFWKEIKKCQLLCRSCHQDKTLRERGMSRARGTHGTVSSYRYCGPPKCEACKKAKRLAQKAWRKKRKARCTRPE